MKKDLKQLHIRQINVARGYRAALRKIKNSIYGNILNAIEYGDWYIPFNSYEYLDIKKHLETKVFHKFFKLPKDIIIKIKDFQTDMLSFLKGH